jgi:aminoglycoside phosphotransferase (APT) family kinase protein
MAVEITDPGHLAARLQEALPRYLLSARGIDARDLRIDDVARPSGGQSNETVLVSCSWDGAGRRVSSGLVVRLQPAGNQLFYDADVVAEGRLLEDLGRHSDVPVPGVLVVEDDSRALGRPFFVMDRVDGHVPGGRPSVHRDAWLSSLSPEARRRAWLNGIRAMAAAHRAPLPALRATAGCAGAGWPIELERVRRNYEWAARHRSHPLIERALDVVATLTNDGASDVLVWGDARPGNIIFNDDATVAAAIDWEMAGVGPREMDLGWWLMMDDFARRGAEGDVLDGIPDRVAVVASYEEASGVTVGDLEPFILLAAVRLAITLIPAADSLIARAIIPVDSRFAHDNVPVQIIAACLGVDEPALSPDYRRLSRMRQEETS